MFPFAIVLAVRKAVRDLDLRKCYSIDISMGQVASRCSDAVEGVNMVSSTQIDTMCDETDLK